MRRRGARILFRVVFAFQQLDYLVERCKPVPDRPAGRHLNPVNHHQEHGLRNDLILVERHRIEAFDNLADVGIEL